MISSRPSAPRQANAALKVPQKERIDARMGVAGSGRMGIVYQGAAPRPGSSGSIPLRINYLSRAAMD